MLRLDPFHVYFDHKRSIPDLNQVMGPAARSPMHHGTDPDLSAATLLPAGVAATGLDLSPATSSRSFHGGAGRVGVSPLQVQSMSQNNLF